MSRPAWVVGLWVVAAAAVHAPQDAAAQGGMPNVTIATLDPPTVDAKTKLAGAVLVWADAKWYLDSDDTASSFTLGDLEGKPRRDRIHRVLPARVVSTKHPDFVEVEWPAADDCAWGRAIINADVSRVRLFVKRTDLAPVVSKRFAATYKNGSRLTLAPGVPVLPTRMPDVYRISFGGDELTIDLPAKHVGFSYAPPTAAKRPVQPRHKPAYLLQSGTVKLGDHSVFIDGAIAQNVTEREFETLVPLSTSCIELVVIAPHDRVVGRVDVGHSDPTPAPTPPVPTKPTGRWQLPKGTKLETVEGRGSAQTTALVDFPEPAPSDSRVCQSFDAMLDSIDGSPGLLQSATDRTVKLCVAVARMRRNPPYDAKRSAICKKVGIAMGDGWDNEEIAERRAAIHRMCMDRAWPQRVIDCALKAKKQQACADELPDADKKHYNEQIDIVFHRYNESIPSGMGPARGDPLDPFP